MGDWPGDTRPLWQRALENRPVLAKRAEGYRLQEWRRAHGFKNSLLSLPAHIRIALQAKGGRRSTRRWTPEEARAYGAANSAKGVEARRKKRLVRRS